VAGGGAAHGVAAGAVPQPWLDDFGRRLFPLEMPEIVCEPGVFVPTQGSYLVWKHLFNRRVGEGLRCLDVGCGTGLLGIQLALNGAEHVHAIDIDRRAVANALSNAFRNGVADRMTGEAVDLYPWVPKDRYDVVVASLYQMPVDPYEQPNSHRPLDFWGRNLLDHLIALLPRLLMTGGVAYLMQLSILGQARTAELLARSGFQARVADFAFFDFHQLFQERRAQIERVEQLSDAYHLRFRDEDVMVAYLLEVTAASTRREAESLWNDPAA
jgi:release factor glutamine methyltransferase